MVEYNLEKEKARLKELLESAQDELVDALKQQDATARHIYKLQEDIVHLAALCGEAVVDPLKDWGLTDAIRYEFGKAKPNALSATEVRDKLAEDGYDISEYRNVLASIHQVIKRLKKKGEIKPILTWAEEEKRYAWGDGLPPPPPIPDRIKKNPTQPITKASRPPHQV